MQDVNTSCEWYLQPVVSELTVEVAINAVMGRIAYECNIGRLTYCDCDQYIPEECKCALPALSKEQITNILDKYKPEIKRTAEYIVSENYCQPETLFNDIAKYDYLNFYHKYFVMDLYGNQPIKLNIESPTVVENCNTIDCNIMKD